MNFITVKLFLFSAVGLNLLNGLGVSGEKILILLPVVSKSETNIFAPIAKALADKGHEITYVSPNPVKNVPKNFNNVIASKPIEATDVVHTTDVMELRKLGKQKIYFWITMDDNMAFDICHDVYKHPDFQKILNQTFDLILIRGLVSNCFDGLIHKFQVPFIIVKPMPVAHWIAARTGFRMPTSFVPAPLLEYTDEMSFTERLGNTVFVWLVSVLDPLIYYPKAAKIYRHYLGEDYPDPAEIQKNVSLILSNSHFSITLPRPTTPDIIEIGGLHCRPAEPLPEDLNQFLSGAKDGVIYFSLGSIVQSEGLPKEIQTVFINVFSRLKQRVIWKFDTKEKIDLPPNVKMSKWLPQQDILGHPNTKLFITHGGLLSTEEATYHGVPMIGIPIFVDQDINVKLTEKSGYSITLEIMDLTEEVLETTIQKVLNDPKYTKRAKELSKIFRDQPQSPLERAIYWIEYVLRHKGAPHLRSASRDLNFIQYHSFDVIAFLLVIISIPIIVIVYLCLRLFSHKPSKSSKSIKLSNGMKSNNLSNGTKSSTESNGTKSNNESNGTKSNNVSNGTKSNNESNGTKYENGIETNNNVYIKKNM